MARKQYLVSRVADGGWIVTVKDRTAHQGPTQANCVKWAIACARGEWADRRIASQVVVQRRDGTLREDWTYGGDPETGTTATPGMAGGG